MKRSMMNLLIKFDSTVTKMSKANFESAKNVMFRESSQKVRDRVKSELSHLHCIMNQSRVNNS